MPGPEEGAQHSPDIEEPENPLLDGAGLAITDARPGAEGQVQLEAEGAGAMLPLQMLRTVWKWLKKSPKKCGFETGRGRLTW